MKRIDLILKHGLYVSIIKELFIAEKNRIYCKHDMEHLLNVARMMMLVNLEEKLGFDKEIIYASALLHDIGRLNQYKTKVKHALYGSELCKGILKDAGFTESEIDEISLAISTHSKMSAETNKLGELLRCCDKKSRNCFICPSNESCDWDEGKKTRGITI